GATGQLQQGRRRNLLLVIDGEKDRQQAVDTPGSTLDTGPTVLHALGWPGTSLGLGRDLLGGDAQDNLSARFQRPNQQIIAWRPFFDAFWQLPSIGKGVAIDSQQREIRLEGRRFPLPVLMRFDRHHELSRFTFEGISTNLPQYLLQQEPGESFGWIDDCSRIQALNSKLPAEGLCAYFGRLDARQSLAIPLPPTSITVPAEDILTGFAAGSSPALAATRRQRLSRYVNTGSLQVADDTGVLPVMKPGLTITLVSAAGLGSDSFVKTPSQRLTLKRGLNLIGVNPEGEPRLLQRLDGCGGPDDARVLTLPRITRQSRHTAYALVVHDSATCPPRDISALIAGLGLEQLPGDAVRLPYVAWYDPDRQQWRERSGKLNTQVRIELGAATVSP
ncbi:MAG: hypothetical protein ACK5HY_13155, partial [Parahaliea sp.]